MKKQEFLDRAHDKHGYKYDYPNLNDKILSNDKVDILYKGVLYKQKVVKHILLGRCPEKNTKLKTTKQFIKESKEVWGDKYDYSITSYKGALKKVKIIYNGIVFEQIASSHLRGSEVENRLTEENFIRKSKIKHSNKYDYSKVKFVNGNTVVMIGYMGIFYSQTPYAHISGSCPEKISLSIKKTTKKFIKDANLIHDFKYNYDKTDYIKNQIKVIITCYKHGDFEQIPNSHLRGSGCPKCNDYLGERSINKFLNKYKISYNRQHKFNNCRNVFELPFDFYIPSMRTCIEFDEIQHYKPVEYFGGIEVYNKLKINDKTKNDYCEENFINLIRIRYNQIDEIWDVLWSHLGSNIRRMKLG